jgi:hypothetical protein
MDNRLARRNRLRRRAIPRGHPSSGNFGFTNTWAQLVKQGSVRHYVFARNWRTSASSCFAL